MALHPQESALLIRLANLGRPIVPRPPDPDAPPRAPHRLEVFGVGIDWVQLTWSALGPGAMTITVADRAVTVDADGGPGAVRVDGLAPGARQAITVRGAGIDAPIAFAVDTLHRPPGESLTSFATISDVHLGGNSTGYLHTIVERPTPAVQHPVRCLQAAVDELVATGVARLIVKGDLVDASTDENWADAQRIFDTLPIPFDVLPGNHELSRTATVAPTVGAARLGVALVEGVHVADRDGVRFVLADSVRVGSDLGTVAAIADPIVEAAADADGPVVVAMHHQPMRFALPTYLPPGIPGPSARRFLRRLGAANPSTLVTSGHTHRHRRHDIGGIVATEVGSTKDFPGTWAGYEVFEGGIVQTVARIAEPSAIRWTDHSRRAAAGVWSRWAPGRRTDRCFTWTW